MFLLLVVALTYKVKTSVLTVNTNVFYTVANENGKLTDLINYTDKTKEETSITYTICDKNKIKDYKSKIVNLIPKIFEDDNFNNTTVKYYVTYDKKDFDISTAKPLKYKTSQGSLYFSDGVTGYLTKNFTKFVLGNKTVDIKFYVIIDYDNLNTYISNNNECATKVKNAKIVKNKDSFIVQNEVYGTMLDMKVILDDLSNKEKIPIKLSDYYTKPDIFASDLDAICDTMNEYANWSVKYTNGIEIKAGLDSVKLGKNNEIILNYDFLTDGVKKVAASYNTVGKKRKFITTSGNKIKVGGTSSSTWGNVVSTDKELAYLKNQFESKTSITDRVPEYLTKRSKIGNTYVEVSIDKQHIWVYVKGKLKMDSAIVTGTKGKHDTPKGLYYMSECIPGKYLVGDGYKTWVNKWMRLTNSGIGLHDAEWRSSFGGSIYTYSGSHGCVNLPSGFANNLFNIAYTGMPVIIY